MKEQTGTWIKPGAHILKTLTNYFDFVWDGRKLFELRRGDRGFEINDYLILREVLNNGVYGRVILAEVTSIIHGDAKTEELFGLKQGFVAMGIRIIAKGK